MATLEKHSHLKFKGFDRYYRYVFKMAIRNTSIPITDLLFTSVVRQISGCVVSKARTLFDQALALVSELT